jgi:alkylation response protein AidB-like acyl-CoA dehydrogenase
MDTRLTERQRMLVEAARAWLKSSWDIDQAGSWLDEGKPLPEAVWRELADLGWLQLSVSERNGGLGGDVLDLALIQEELGKALFPPAFQSTMLLARLLDRVAQEGTVHHQALQELVTGAARGSVAMVEEGGAFLAPRVGTRLVHAGTERRLRGEKWFVRSAEAADYIAVLAAVEDAAGGAKPGFVLVEPRKGGVTCSRQESAGRDRQYRVRFDDVPVPDTHVITLEGTTERLLPAVQVDAMLLECGYLAGVAARAHEMTVQHALQRVQFGRPIGSFQAIQHKVADMTRDVDGARMMTYYAAHCSRSEPALFEAMSAKLWVSEAVQRVLREAQQIHGGIGFTVEHPLHRYFRYAKTGELLFGAPYELLDRMADDLVGQKS